MTALVNPDPECCVEPMVHNTFTGEFECLQAYTVLHDHGVDPYLVDPRDLPLRLQGEWEHWNGSRQSDGGAE